MGLLDFFGTAFGGSPDQNDLTAQMIAQMGGDPAAMQRQAAMQGLGQLGAAMLANSGPSTTRKSFGQILGAGLQQGMQSFQDARKQGVNQLYIAENVKRAKAQDDEAERKRQQGEALKASIAQVPVAQWPEAMRPYANILTNLPGDQLVDMLTKYNAQAAADARAAKVQEGQDARQQRQFEQQLAMQDRISARSIAAANAPAKAPAYWSMLSPEEQAAAARVQAGLDPKGGGGGLTKSQQNAVARRSTELQGQLQGADAAGALIDTIQHKFDTGYYAPSSNPLTRAFNANAPAAWRTGKANELDKDLNDLVVQVQQSMHGRQSVALLNAIQASKPSIGMEGATIQHVLDSWRQQLRASTGRTQAELAHYDGGGSVESFKPAESGNVQGNGQPGAGRPPGLPATAQQGQDGNWYDPSTGKRYVYRP